MTVLNETTTTEQKHIILTKVSMTYLHKIFYIEISLFSLTIFSLTIFFNVDTSLLNHWKVFSRVIKMLYKY